MVRARRSASTPAITRSPTRSRPDFSAPLWPNTVAWIFWVSSTMKVPDAPAISPLSPTWPPDSA
ncbi:hypothetical protein D3C83_135710 [compost metagenome]